AKGTALKIVQGGVAGASFTLTSATGPFTCGMLPDGSIETYTAGLNGALNFDITSITVATGATFQLGTPGASTGFKFSSAV
ncbi:unnamed protein product, partial [Rotaria magnacalcarata]